jgi:hypothetical protein
VLETAGGEYDQEWLDYQYEIALRHRRKKNQTDHADTAVRPAGAKSRPPACDSASVALNKRTILVFPMQVNGEEGSEMSPRFFVRRRLDEHRFGTTRLTHRPSPTVANVSTLIFPVALELADTLNTKTCCRARHSSASVGGLFHSGLVQNSEALVSEIEDLHSERKRRCLSRPNPPPPARLS